MIPTQCLTNGNLTATLLQHSPLKHIELLGASLGSPGAHRRLPLGGPSKASSQLLRQLLPHRPLSLCQSAQSGLRFSISDSLRLYRYVKREKLSWRAASC